MPGIDELVRRIDAEFGSVDDRIKKFQTDRVKSYQERQQRFDKFGQLCDRLRSVWAPRLEALAKRFSDRVQVTPTVEPTRREARFEFKSNLAQIRLKFSVTTDQDVTQVFFNYDVDILPILMQFESHTELAMPLDAVDEQLVANWIDDRIIQFVRTYLSLHENQFYLKDHLVEDPIAHCKFPRYAAAATVERQGKTHYFISEQTKQEFEKTGR
jgi:YHS domain-containing protein